MDAVLTSGKQQRELGSGRENLLRKLVNIGYENQFSPEERIRARRDIKEAIAEQLGQSAEGVFG